MSVRPPSELLCKDVVEVVTDYLGDGLTPVEHARIEQHLLVCPPCANHVSQVRTTIALVGELRFESKAEAEPAPSPDPKLLELFRRWRAGDPDA